MLTGRTLQKLAHRRIQEGIANHDESDQESQYDSDDSRSSSDHEVPVTPERNGAAANSNAEAGGTSIDVPVVVVPAGVEGILIDGKNAIRDEGRKGESRVNANADNDSSTSTESGAKPTKSRIPGRIALPGKFTTTTSIRIDLPASGSTNDDQHSPGQNGTSQHEKRAVEEGAYLKSRLWWCGLGLITIGEGGNFLSYGFAPASVVAPLGTIVSSSLTLLPFSGKAVRVLLMTGANSKLPLCSPHSSRTLSPSRTDRDGPGDTWGSHGRMVKQQYQS